MKKIAILLILITWFPAIAKPRILAVGDSLTEGYSLPKENSYPSLLQAKLQASGFAKAKVVNAGSAGATSASGLETIKWHLSRMQPDLIFYALGSNDGLRGIAPETTKSNIAAAIRLAQKKKVKFILAGLKAPPNYGKTFPKEFENIFPDLAKSFKVPLVPFLLANVAAVPDLNLADGIHPNAKGYKEILKTIYPFIVKQL